MPIHEAEAHPKTLSSRIMPRKHGKGLLDVTQRNVL
jgi:hypothetical protein